MKNLILILSVILFVSCSDSKKNVKIEKKDIQKDELNGKVKLVEEKNYDGTEKFGELIKTKLIDWIITSYNGDGNMTQMKYLFSDSDPDWVFFSLVNKKYDKKGRLIEEESKINPKQFGTMGVYKYDKNGNNLEINYIDSIGKTLTKQVKKYDLKNNQIEYIFYGEDGSKGLKSASKFDDDNNLIEIKNYYYDNDSPIYTGKQVSEYGWNGNKTEENEYDLKGSLNKNIKFDKNENIIEENYYDNKGILKSNCKYVYDENGDKLETMITEGNKETKKINKFNKFRHCFERYEYSNNVLKDVVKCIFKYDHKGNWIKKTWYKNERVGGILERKIQYYD